jgi:hypothetical protein
MSYTLDVESFSDLILRQPSKPSLWFPKGLAKSRAPASAPASLVVGTPNSIVCVGDDEKPPTVLRRCTGVML